MFKKKVKKMTWKMLKKWMKKRQKLKTYGTDGRTDQQTKA